MRIPEEIQAALPRDNTICGNDLVYLPDFRAMLNPAFKRRAYTPRETAYCEQFSEPTVRYASTWAAKEAVYKVLRQAAPTMVIPWRSLEILRDTPGGAPRLETPTKIAGLGKIGLTLTHDGDYVWALAILTQIR